ncbi:MAG: gephyrin-like molybdotransferase Glp [Nitrososphaeria archaeon]|jgi:molybdopterin molybdotransferase
MTGKMYDKVRSFKSLRGVEESIDLMFKSLKKPDLGVSEIAVSDSLHHFCAVHVLSRFDSPKYDKSAVDGYAVISEDVLSSSTTNPTVLRVIQEIRIDALKEKIRPLCNGETAIVYTGSPLPANSNAVVMVEDTKLEGSSVLVYRSVPQWLNVSRRGEDFVKGSVVVEKGVLIRPWHLAALLSTGSGKIKVFRRLRVGVLSTGSELKYSTSQNKSVIDSTKPLILSMSCEEFCEPVDLGVVEDDVEIISSKILEASSGVDAIVTTGGTSVGATDLVEEAVTKIGYSSVLFYGVRMRPGRPTGLALVQGKPVFMLSGYPVAAFTGFEVFVKPAINFLRGSKPLSYPVIKACLTRRLVKPVGVKAFVRVKVEKYYKGGFSVEPMRLTGSGLLSSLTRGNGLLIMEEGLEGYDEGESVDVLLFQPLEG